MGAVGGSGVLAVVFTILSGPRSSRWHPRLTPSGGLFCHSSIVVLEYGILAVMVSGEVTRHIHTG